MKRKQLMQTGKELFWRYGIKRVTVEEICQEAGVSKMTFYKHFRNKNELVRAIIDRVTGDALDQYRIIMQQDISFEEKVRESIRLKYEGIDRMSREFLNDYLPQAEPGIRDFVQKRTREALGLIMEDYRKAQQRGDIRQDIKIEFILYFLNKMIELMGDKELEKLYANPQEQIMELVNFFFYGIMPRRE